MADLNVPGSAGAMRVHSQRASAQYYREALDRVLAALGWTNVRGEGRGQPFDVVGRDEPRISLYHDVACHGMSRQLMGR